MSIYPHRAEIHRSNRRRFVTRVTAVTAFALLLFAQAQAQTTNGSPNLVISQIYTRGGEAGASYNKDFVEIFNRGTAPVDFNNYGLQVTLDSGSSIPASLSLKIVSSRGLVIQPGRYLLIAFKGSGTDGQPLPTPDFDLGAFLPDALPSNLSAASGAVVLVPPDGSYTSCFNASNSVTDLVGYGPQAPCVEGLPTGPAPAPTLTASLQRYGEGCTDNNLNASDLRLSPVLPRNSGWPAALCAVSTPTSFFNFAAPQFDTQEGAGHATVTVTRTGDLSTAATVEYSTTSGGSASERSDYTTAAGRLRFAPGESQKTFDVLLTDDSTQEQNETVALLIWNPAGNGVSLGTRDHATLVIHDNDLDPAASNPIDSTAFFVRQHYHDFLNREPDASGLQFWIDGIESCGADQQCREVKRIDTSAAFFLSIEFQRTGFLVYRLYKASLPEQVYRLRSLPRYLEFVRDTQEVGRNVVVGQTGWEQTLEANTKILIDDFVTRTDFALNYPESMLPTDYVDKLNAQAGSPLTQAERDQLVAGLLLGTETRATVLRKVAESPEFTRRETNRAFVYMQYLGYLRRAPNDPPDTDFSGMDFWLSKLDQFGGDYRRAEMVKAFINSIEYRARFQTPAP